MNTLQTSFIFGMPKRARIASPLDLFRQRHLHALGGVKQRRLPLARLVRQPGTFHVRSGSSHQTE